LVESHALIDSLKNENNMMFNTIDTLENKLQESEDIVKKIASDNLKSMLSIHTYIPNNPDLIIDDLSASTSHASDFELDSIVFKPVIVDTACLDNLENSCLNGFVKPKSKESGTQDKFVPTCHNCGNIGHIRPNCYLLKSNRPWNKQVVPEKGKMVHRRYLSQEGKNFILCENANLKSAHLSRNILANKDNLPAITMVSQDT